MLMNKNIKILFLCVPLVLASCASKKNLVKETSAATKTAVESQKTASLISQNLAIDKIKNITQSNRCKIISTAVDFYLKYILQFNNYNTLI